MISKFRDDVAVETTTRTELFYRQSFLIRTFEERLLQLFSEGQLFGTTHAYVGQEANAVGVLAHLTPSDVVFSNHRCHGHYLAYTDDVEGLLAEIMGRETGMCRGKGGSQHICKGNFYTNGVLGGIVPCATGIALAESLKKSSAKTVVFLGDGALGEGVVYESFNIAALWSIPMMFVIENNFYAQSTPSYMQISGEIAARPRAFDIETETLCPETAHEVYDAAAVGWSYIEEHRRPYALVLDTYRFSPHSKSDDFRAPEELAEWRARDPLQRLGAELDAVRRARIEEEVRARVEAAVAAAKESSFPGADSIAW